MGRGFLKNLWPNYRCTQMCKGLPFEMDQSIWKRDNTMCPPNNICGLHVDDLSLLLYLFTASQSNNVLIAVVQQGSTLKAKFMGSTTSFDYWSYSSRKVSSLRQSTRLHCPAGQERCQCHDEGLGGISAPWPKKTWKGKWLKMTSFSGGC